MKFIDRLTDTSLVYSLQVGSMGANKVYMFYMNGAEATGTWGSNEDYFIHCSWQSAMNCGGVAKFGNAIALHENTLVIGAFHLQGRAFVFERDGTNNWTFEQEIRYCTTADGNNLANTSHQVKRFGYSVDVFGDTVVVSSVDIIFFTVSSFLSEVNLSKNH